LIARQDPRSLARYMARKTRRREPVIPQLENRSKSGMTTGSLSFPYSWDSEIGSLSAYDLGSDPWKLRAASSGENLGVSSAATVRRKAVDPTARFD
jgi:hypothetical protein